MNLDVVVEKSIILREYEVEHLLVAWSIQICVPVGGICEIRSDVSKGDSPREICEFCEEYL